MGRSIFLGLCLLLSFASRATAESKDSFHVVALIPLTGSAAEQGAWIRDGLKLGAERARTELGVDVQVAYEDTAADPKTAINAYQNLRSREPFDLFFTYGSGVGIALSPASNRDKVVQIGLATASPAYRSPDDYTFRNFPSAELEAAFMVHYVLRDRGARSVGIVRIENDYGIGSSSAFRKEFETNGGTVLFEEAVEPNTTDFKSVLTKIRAVKPQLIFLAVYPNEGALLLRQARQLGIASQFVASVAILGSKEFVKLAGGGAEGLLISTSTPIFLESTSPVVKRFVARYREALGEDPSVQAIFAARAYDAVFLAAQAFKACGTGHAECLKDTLFKVRNFDGASGSITFDRFGDISNNFSMMQFRDGAFRSVK